MKRDRGKSTLCSGCGCCCVCLSAAHTRPHFSIFCLLFSKCLSPSTLAHCTLQNGDDREQRSSLGGGNCQMVILLKCSSSFGKLPPFLLGLRSPLVWKWAGSNPGGCLHASSELKRKLNIFRVQKNSQSLDDA